VSLTDIRPDLKNKLSQILENKNLGHTSSGRGYALDFNINKIPYTISEIANQKQKKYNHFILEIGSGWGEFTLENAKLHPKSFILALEKKKHRIIHCIKEQKKQNLNNINWMIVDVTWFFKNLFKEKSFDRIIMNFPDPWPKTRHQKHRFMSEEMIDTLSRISKKNAILEFATDYWPYMEETFFMLENSDSWKNIHGKGLLLSKVKNRPVSHFESLKKSEGENIYHLQMIKQ